MNFHTHVLVAGKSILVLLGWVLIDTAIKHLPITIVSPVKASQPVFVLLGAMTIFSERLNLLQWAGVALSIFSFYILSKSGQKEGIHFRSNKWVFCIVAGVLLNAACGLFDKFLMVNYSQMAVFVWYNLYLTLFMGITFLIQHFFIKKEKFVWRWPIFFVAVFICLSDFTYFYSLSCEGSMVSIVSMIRRSGIVISFLLGAWIFHEKNIKQKAVGLFLMLISIFFLLIGSINH